MNKILLLAISLSTLMFASLSMAGGAGCNSKKAHSEDMSATLEQIKEHHAWLKSEGHIKGEPGSEAVQDMDAEKEIAHGTKPALIEI